MNKESYDYMNDLLSDPNLENLELDVCEEDDELYILVECRDPEDQEIYGYEADVSLRSVRGRFPNAIGMIRRAIKALESKEV